MNEKNVNAEVTNELSEAEVNVYCDCETNINIHCNHDCPFGGAWYLEQL